MIPKFRLFSLKSTRLGPIGGVLLAMVLFSVFWFVTPYQAAAQTGSATKLIVLPFEINAAPDLDHLHEGLPELLRDQLRANGFEVHPGDQTSLLLRDQELTELDLSAARDMALLSASAHAIYGSFSQIGENISLDVRLVEAFGLKPAKSFFVVRDGLINLLPAVEELAELVTRELRQVETIAEILVEGNQTLGSDVVLLRIRSQKGDIYDPQVVNEDIRRLFELGFFDDITIQVEDGPSGKILTFEVTERPRIQAISVVGAKEIKEGDILKAITTRSGSIINPRILSDDLGKIRELYRQKGYYLAQVDYNLEQTDPRQARLNITVDEGNRLFIRDIVIEGAESLSQRELRKELVLGERGLFSWLTGTGILREELLERDAAALEAYYANRGFLDARVGQPEVEYLEEGIRITFKVEEGSRYKVGTIGFRGDLLDPEEELLKLISLDDLQARGTYFDRSVLRQDLQSLADHYTEYGYAFAQSDAQLDIQRDELLVNVVYILDKGSLVYIRRVLIEGNTKTRDNVIRREMRLGDGDLFSGAKLARSNERLVRLDFFELVDIETLATPDPSELDLKVTVKEKPTGMLSAGLGYSSLDKVFVSGTVQERNLFGRAYNLSFRGTFSGRSTIYDLSLTNPAWRDSLLGVGADLYYWTRDYKDYDRKAVGGRFRLSYPLGEYTRLFWNYRLERYTISDVKENAAQRIRDAEGTKWASSTYAAVSRDTTDRIFNPSRGTVNTLSVQYAGGALQGDDHFIKSSYDSHFYYPLFWGTVFHWRGQIGLLFDNDGKEAPVFERFYLGGIDSVRGYPGMEISPRDPETNDRIGGTKQFFTNFEYMFPLNQEMGLVGLLFFDAGNVWDHGESFGSDLYKSIGAGIRWYSPLGPLRLEYGYGLDRLEGDRQSGIEFTIGQIF
ncbi:outer membrane protein assembly factor BamA [Desulfonatronum thiodismutans]|uniref:outer membrane protein assembly factor BamA n=1 Tax=Desulfonatronum thiodismutans TaxID=159290 RepID=UPI0004ABECDD|nr:outer membrane protein assembly factor BamA [Desulfonatronum thiodismutans]